MPKLGMTHLPKKGRLMAAGWDMIGIKNKNKNKKYYYESSTSNKSK